VGKEAQTHILVSLAGSPKTGLPRFASPSSAASEREYERWVRGARSGWRCVSVDEPLLLLWRRVSAIPCVETRVVRGLSPKAVCVCETSVVACLCVSFECDSLSEELGREEKAVQTAEDGFCRCGRQRICPPAGTLWVVATSLAFCEGSRGQAHVK